MRKKIIPVAAFLVCMPLYVNATTCREFCGSTQQYCSIPNPDHSIPANISLENKDAAAYCDCAAAYSSPEGAMSCYNTSIQNS